MIKLAVNNIKGNNVFTSFEEVNLKHIKAAYELLSFLPKNEMEAFKKGEPMPPKFMIDWVAIFSDLTHEVLENINIESDDDVNLTSLFFFTRHFGEYPSNYVHVKEFKHKGKKYKVIPALTTISGTEMLLGNASYKQHKLMAQLSTAVDNANKGKVVEALQQLLAVFYTDGDDTEEGIKKRIEAFKDLQAFTAWSGWFFFVQLTASYKSFFQSYSSPLAAKKAQLKTHVESLKIAISKTFIGRLLKTKWLKVEYSVLEE